MPLVHRGWRRFGGLRLDVDPLEAGGEVAIDGLDFDIGPYGRLRPRAGTRRGLAAGTGHDTVIYAMAAVGSTVLVAGETAVKAISGNLGTVDASIAQARVRACIARAFDGTNDVFVISGNSVSSRTAGVVLYRPYGASFSDITRGATVDGVAGQYQPRFRTAAVTPWGSYRYCGCGSTPGVAPGLAENQDRIWFSEGGAALNWTSTNYVDVAPGTGVGITAITAWRDLLFVFREDRFAVFHGESTLADGTPVFLHRMVTVGLGTAWPEAVAVAPEGVYFATEEGHIVLTDGNSTRIVSSAVEGALRAGGLGADSGSAEPAPPWFTGWFHRSRSATMHLAYADGRLYVRSEFTLDEFGLTTATRTLVYIVERDAWLAWTLAPDLWSPVHSEGIGEALALVRYDGTGRLWVGYFNPDRDDRTYDWLAGASVPAPTWRSGLYALADGHEVTLRTIEVLGRSADASAVNLAVAEDDGAFDTGDDLALTDSTIPAGSLARRTRRGRYLSHRLSGVTAGRRWTVHEIACQVETPSRPLGVRA